jgi:DNA invertase Pin-like site-specific DNA recombinase
MRAAIYARVSTNNGQDPHMQIRELREYCQRRGWDIEGEYVDAGVCGAKERRPQLDVLLAACRKRRVDAVVVYRYDRFARSLRQLVNALEEFRSLGIEFISLHEGVDTSTPNGRLIFGIFASIAEFERELIRDRVKSGIAAARSKGKRLGRPRVSVDAASIAALRNSGASWSTIARQLGLRRYGEASLLQVVQKPTSRPHSNYLIRRNCFSR